MSFGLCPVSPEDRECAGIGQGGEDVSEEKDDASGKMPGAQRRSSSESQVGGGVISGAIFKGNLGS